ncbi:MAG: chromate resistance protein ChrB domain-containing protein [Pseudomonadota bacterium]
MAKPQPAESDRWLALIASLPTDDPAARMRMLRTLESLGAAVMREGAYLLPDTPACRQGLERLAEYIARGAGSAQVLQVAPLSDPQRSAFRALFDRSARYAELIKVVESLKVGYGIADPSAISRVLHKQRREFEAIDALDFFPTEVRERARGALAEAESAVHRLIFPARTRGGAKAGEPLHRRTWATRRPAWADRLACAWLIRRFVDPEGSVAWLDKAQPCPPEALGFAFEGARFGNSASRVTFEEMLQQFGLADNAALAKIGSIVHFLEVRDTPVPEAAGVQTLLQGAARRSASDQELLGEAEKTFDLLYEAYFEPPKK